MDTSLFPCLHVALHSVWPVISLFLGRSCYSAPTVSRMSIETAENLFHFVERSHKRGMQC